MAKQKSIFDYLECNRDGAAGDYFCPKCKRWGRKYQHKSQCHECRNEWRRRNAQKLEVRAAIRKSSQEHYERERAKPEVARRRAEYAAKLAAESAVREVQKLRRARLRAILRRIDALIRAHPWQVWQQREMNRLKKDCDYGRRGDLVEWKRWAAHKVDKSKQRFQRPKATRQPPATWKAWAKRAKRRIDHEAALFKRKGTWSEWAICKARLLHRRFTQKEMRREHQRSAYA